jgi:hypothetical protein
MPRCLRNFISILSSLLIDVSVAKAEPAEDTSPLKLPGTYVSNFGTPPETIELKPAGIYTHTFKSGNRQNRHDGKWIFRRRGDSQQLVLEKFRFGDAWSNLLRSPGFWPPEVRILAGKTRVYVSDDLKLYFEKQCDTSTNTKP